MLNIVLVILCAAAALVVGKAAGKWAFGAKKNLTAVRKSCQSLAISLRGFGLKRIPETVEGFVVGDIDDLLVGLQDLAKLLASGNATLLDELEGTFTNCLSKKLSTPEGRALVEAKLQEAKAVAIECAKAAAPVVAKAAAVAIL